MPKMKRIRENKIVSPSEIRTRSHTRSRFRAASLDKLASPSPDTINERAAIIEHKFKDLAVTGRQILITATERTKAHIAKQFDNILENISKGKIDFELASTYIKEKNTSNRESDLGSLLQLRTVLDNYDDRKPKGTSNNSNNRSYITDDIMGTYQTLDQKSDSYEFSHVWRYFHNMSPPERELFREGWEVTPITPTASEEKWFKREMKVSAWKDKDDIPGFILDHPQALLQRFIKHETEKIINQPIIAHLEKKCEQELDDPKKETYKQILEYLHTGEQPTSCKSRIETYGPPELDKKLQRLRAGIREEGKVQEGEFIPEREQTYVTIEARSLWSKFTKEKAITKRGTNTKLNDADKRLILANLSDLLIGSSQTVKEFDEYGKQIALWKSLPERVIEKGPFIIGIDYRTRNDGGVYIISVDRKEKGQVIAISTACISLSNKFGFDKNRIQNALKNRKGATIPEGTIAYAWIDSKGRNILS